MHADFSGFTLTVKLRRLPPDVNEISDLVVGSPDVGRILVPTNL